jgi:hypothetical protein
MKFPKLRFRFPRVRLPRFKVPSVQYPWLLAIGVGCLAVGIMFYLQPPYVRFSAPEAYAQPTPTPSPPVFRPPPQPVVEVAPPPKATEAPPTLAEPPRTDFEQISENFYRFTVEASTDWKLLPVQIKAKQHFVIEAFGEICGLNLKCNGPEGYSTAPRGKDYLGWEANELYHRYAREDFVSNDCPTYSLILSTKAHGGPIFCVGRYYTNQSSTDYPQDMWFRTNAPTSTLKYTKGEFSLRMRFK